MRFFKYLAGGLATSLGRGALSRWLYVGGRPLPP